MSPHPHSRTEIASRAFAWGGAWSLLFACGAPRNLPQPEPLQETQPRSNSGAPAPDAPAPDAPVPDAEQDARENRLEPSAVSAPFGDRDRLELAVDGFLPAQAWVPRDGGAAPYRLVVVAHGAGGRAVDHCAFWDARLAGDVLLLCVTGRPLRTAQPQGGAYFPDHLALRRELERALASVSESTWGSRIEDPPTFIGYSQGATMGALAIVGELIFARLVLLEGGGENWTRSRVLQFRERGGQAVYLGCGTRGCSEHAGRAASAFSESGVAFRAGQAPGAGHTYWGEVGDDAFEQLSEWGYDPHP